MARRRERREWGDGAVGRERGVSGLVVVIGLGPGAKRRGGEEEEEGRRRRRGYPCWSS